VVGRERAERSKRRGAEQLGEKTRERESEGRPVCDSGGRSARSCSADLVYHDPERKFIDKR
jgi:hypothetical protein